MALEWEVMAGMALPLFGVYERGWFWEKYIKTCGF